jgi:signal transduction histidine kinase
MKPLLSQIRRSAAPRRALDFRSLNLRIALEVAVLTTLGLGSVAAWTGWKMQQILIASHTQNVSYVADRFPRDVELFSDMLPLDAGLKKTIANVVTPGTLIWVKGTNGQLLAESTGFGPGAPPSQALMNLAEMPLQPQIYQLGPRYWVLYGGDIAIKGQPIGRVYIAQDVTSDQQQLNAANQSLIGIFLLVIVIQLSLVLVRIRQLLLPLESMSQMAGAISAEDLSQARLQVSDAPSEVKELVQAFNLLLGRLADAWEKQRQFVSDVSHELRTPLTIVQGYLQSLLRRSTNLTDVQREALETATSETERTVRLLQNLLDLARSENGSLQTRLGPVALDPLLREVAGAAQRGSQRSVQVVAEAAVQGIADRDQLKQVLINLIDNAIKYSAPDRPVILKLTQTDSHAQIQVCDMGLGIALQDQGRVFDRFYRVDGARSPGGYGLGLAITKSLVEGMGGQISLQSILNEGSTFTIVLPISP